MPTRYILATTLQNIETKFGLPPQNIIIEPNYNITPGQYVPVITSDKPHEIQLFKFGLTPFWAKSEMNLFNARAEGDSNLEDNPSFRGATGIILKKAFRRPIRSQRCLVLASAFITVPTNPGLSKPFLVYLRKHQNPFAFAGIWDTWFNPQTGDNLNSFSTITTKANSLLRTIGSKRMPVILTDHQAKKWINPLTELSTITGMLRHYDSKLMNAYPIDPAILNKTEITRSNLMPIGPKLIDESVDSDRYHIPTNRYSHHKKSYSSAEKTVPFFNQSGLIKNKI